MVLAEIKEIQLKHINDVITNKKYWYNDKFRLLNNEAGIGKSIQTFKSIAKLATTTETKVVYVQMFANKDSYKQDAEELKNTVDLINKYAGKEVAEYICSENIDKQKAIIKTAQVICITHRKYLELCKEHSTNFITDSDVLIIDEFPNLFQSFYVSELELTKLQGFTLLTEKQDKDDIMELNNFVKNKLNEFLKRYGKSEMRIINLQKLDVKRYFKILETIIAKAKKDNETAHKKIIEYAEMVMELFKHSSVFSTKKIGSKKYPVLYSFYKDTDYILAKENNVILDANAGFDKRYKLRKSLFKLDYQRKTFDYKDSYINFYPISTTKTALKNYKNIILDVAEYINNHKYTGFSTNETLIITDVARENKITSFQKQYFEASHSIKIAHFGALIGKNDWKDYNHEWIIKTPFYVWVEYILQYMFYSKKDLNGHTSCEYKTVKGRYNNYRVFRNEKFNSFKNSIVKGECYQAFKRIARDGRQCTLNILTADEALFYELKKEFKNVKEQVKTDLEIEIYVKPKHKKTGKKPVKTNERNEKIKEYLIEAKNNGKSKIEKSELCSIADIRKDKLSKQLNNIRSWMNKNEIVIGTGKEQSYMIL